MIKEDLFQNELERVKVEIVSAQGSNTFRTTGPGTIIILGVGTGNNPVVNFNSIDMDMEGGAVVPNHVSIVYAFPCQQNDTFVVSGMDVLRVLWVNRFVTYSTNSLGGGASSFSPFDSSQTSASIAMGSTVILATITGKGLAILVSDGTGNANISIQYIVDGGAPVGIADGSSPFVIPVAFTSSLIFQVVNTDAAAAHPSPNTSDTGVSA